MITKLGDRAARPDKFEVEFGLGFSLKGNVAVDPRIPAYLGRVINSSGAPVGTCFQVSPGILMTAWHVLDELGSGDGEAISWSTP